MRLRIILIIAVGLCVNLCNGSGDKKQYCYKFEKSQQYYIKHITRRKVEPKSGRNKGIMVEQNFSFGYQVVVKEVDEKGGAWLEFRYEWVSIKQKDFEKEVSYNSAKNDDNISPLLWGYRALLGEVFQVKISRLGEIEQVKGFVELHQSVKEKIKPNPGRKMLVRQIQNQFNDFLMRELLTNLTDIYTDKKVKQGSSWSKSLETSYDAQIVFNNKYKVNEVTDDGFAIIGLKSKIKTKFGAKPVIRGSVTLKTKSSGSQSGTIKINESTGEIISSDINQKMTAIVEVSSKASKPKSNHVEVESSIHFEFKKLALSKVEVEK
jgi:hypothetical protein